MEQRALNVAEAARVLNVHPLTIRKAITRGELRAVRIGRKVLVPVAAIDASWTHAQPQQANYRANDLAGKNGPPPRLPATRRRLASGSVASCRRLGEVSMVVATLTPFNRIVAALEARGCRRQGHDFQCPAHDDNRASLSVRAARDRVLIHCHAECSVEDVVAALGLQMADLFESGGERLTDSTICATYDYTNETGELLFQVVRSWPKSFRQRRPNGNGGWEWNLDGVRRVPFHLPQLVEGLKNGSTIYVVEGEKDVLAIEKAGGVATCNPGGVGKWRVEYSDHLAGANVVVVADKDDPGRKHAEAVASSLRDRAHRVSIVEPAEGKDASDHLGAGKVLADFVPLVPASRKESGRLRISNIEDVGRRVADAGVRHFLTRRTIVAGSYGVLGAQFKALKSFDMLDLAVSVATGTPWLDLFDCPVPGRVLLFAGEGTEAELMFRVLAVCEHKGIRPRDLAGLIRTAASVPRFMDKDDMDILTMELESFEPSLCLIDPAYVALRGAQQGSLTDIGERLEPIRTATQDAGVTLTLAWHWNQTGVGSGPQRFTGAGAAEWGRFLGSAKLERKWREDGVLNSQKLYDWSGSEIPDFQFRVTQRVWSDDPDDINSLLHYDVVANEVHSDPGEDWKPTFYMAKVSRFVETEAEPPSLNRICDVVTGKKEFKRQAVAALVRDGYLRVEDGPRGSQLHHFIKPYLEPQK